MVSLTSTLFHQTGHAHQVSLGARFGIAAIILIWIIPAVVDVVTLLAAVNTLPIGTRQLTGRTLQQYIYAFNPIYCKPFQHKIPPKLPDVENGIQQNILCMLCFICQKFVWGLHGSYALGKQLSLVGYGHLTAYATGSCWLSVILPSKWFQAIYRRIVCR